VQDNNSNAVDKAVTEGGAYDVIRKRLVEQGRALKSGVDALNSARISEFGSTDMKVLGRIRTRSENNCVAQDIIRVGEYLLFGFNVFLGLKKEIHITDVFNVYSFKRGVGEDKEGFELEAVTWESTFLNCPSFLSDFNELYTYYKDTRLAQTIVKDGKLLLSFQIGERPEDIRVFRFSVSSDESEIKYLDNRGERDIALPNEWDFEWIETARENAVNGRHPHVNILDTVFVEAVGGDLTVKIEDNTDSGKGIYEEDVVDKTQSLDDASICYAQVGNLILMKILPYRETEWRYLVFNKLTNDVKRIDAIGQACRALPENHGIIFPGGIYLETGEMKIFDDDMTGMKFRRMRRSPNGEDVMYIFFKEDDGKVALFAYNLIEKSLQPPQMGHGYALMEDGTMVIFYSELEPTRIHPMQIWSTPYCTEEFASSAPPNNSFYGKIGNAELVRAISDFYSITREISNQSVSMTLYNELCQNTQRLFDAYFWLDSDTTADIWKLLHDIDSTSELVLDEFEKVESIRAASETALSEALTTQKKLLSGVNAESWHEAEQFVDALTSLRHQRGHLLTIREYRYIDVLKIDEMEQQLLEASEKVSAKTGEFLSSDKAIAPYHDKLATLDKALEVADTVQTLEEPSGSLEKMAGDLDLLSELMTTMKVDDPNQRTAIIESISEVYAKLNQSRARAGHKLKSLGSAEAVAQFSASFKLFSQGISNALTQASTPEKCDEQLTRLLIQLEELESQFSEHDEFLNDILAKREEIYESFESHKQALLDERQRKAQNLLDAATRILANIERRVGRFTEVDELNSFYAADPLVLKVRDISSSLRDLDDQIKADDIESKFKAGRDQAIKTLRDKSEIFEEGGSVIKLGPRHRFSVNSQQLDITILPRGDELYYHLTGTDFFEPVIDPELVDLSSYWQAEIESESDDIYRAEYLAGLVLDAADNNTDGLSLEGLKEVQSDFDDLVKLIRKFTAPRYKEGYEKGIHDHDAAKILSKILPLRESAGLLRFDPLSRGLAAIFWANNSKLDWAISWPERAKSAMMMKTLFASNKAIDLLQDEIQSKLNEYLHIHPIAASANDCKHACLYLVQELAQEHPAFVTSKYARLLVDKLKRALESARANKEFEQALKQLEGRASDRWSLTHSWLSALIASLGSDEQHLQSYIPEAISIINAEERIARRNMEADLNFEVTSLLGNHGRIQEQKLPLALDSFLSNYFAHRDHFVPAYHRYLSTRQRVIDDKRKQLKLHEFASHPLSSFVRNRLINEVYLAMIGDNLAKQMGTVGENKRTDLMGLLMMISPPGYGKTTLMEYVANRLGLVFMKINCPSVGHEVDSLDPAQAPNATAKQELEKLNLALEMGNNAMLYLDDIQHTNPEFLQKFISLCDGTRRIEGVWRGESKTYDMRGKKFCVIMAGNPYTESGEVFRIPDMLANRADIYNLGEVLGGMDEQFALSYIENTLTSNSVLQPLATREMSDLYQFVAMAESGAINTNDLSHSYSGAEVNEIVDVLAKLLKIRDVILLVNAQYIKSASQADKYRTEPPFKLQGSYRNMNKMAEKVSSVMNDEELALVIADHYLGESQLLTGGSEENLLKLAELRGIQDETQQKRWQQIKADFRRNNAMGGDDTDGATKVVGKLHELVESVQGTGTLFTEINEQKLTQQATLLEQQQKHQQQQDKTQQAQLQQGREVAQASQQQLISLLSDNLSGLSRSWSEGLQQLSSNMNGAQSQAQENRQVLNTLLTDGLGQLSTNLTQGIEQIAGNVIGKQDLAQKAQQELQTILSDSFSSLSGSVSQGMQQLADNTSGAQSMTKQLTEAIATNASASVEQQTSNMLELRQIQSQLHQLVESVVAANGLMEETAKTRNKNNQALLKVSQAQVESTQHQAKVFEAQQVSTKEQIDKVSDAFLNMYKVFSQTPPHVEVVNQPQPELEKVLKLMAKKLLTT